MKTPKLIKTVSFSLIALCLVAVFWVDCAQKVNIKGEAFDSGRKKERMSGMQIFIVSRKEADAVYRAWNRHLKPRMDELTSISNRIGSVDYHGTNQYIEWYRSQHPNDTRSDFALTLALGNENPTLVDKYPDFASAFFNFNLVQLTWIYDAERSEPLSNAPEVRRILESAFSVTTDRNGEFTATLNSGAVYFAIASYNSMHWKVRYVAGEQKLVLSDLNAEQ